VGSVWKPVKIREIDWEHLGSPFKGFLAKARHGRSFIFLRE
jgi:hypothetical protein